MQNSKIPGNVFLSFPLTEEIATAMFKIYPENASRKILIVNFQTSNTVHIMFLDACSDFKRERLALQKNLNILHRTELKGPRPFILIFLINRNNTFDMRLFLNKIWGTQYYLYVTIIEVSNQASCKKQLNASQSSTQENVFVHQYNPFNDTYQVVPLFETRKLFNHKLRNLHGYILRGSHSETQQGFIPSNGISGKKYTRRHVFSLASSNSELVLMKTIAQILNFTINVTTDMSVLEMWVALRRNELDFSMNSIPTGHLSGIAGIPYFHETTYILIKQYGYTTTQFPWHLVLYIGVILVIIIITKYSLLLLGSESHFSSLYNIAMIVIGISTPVEPKKLREQILYVFLITISVFFSAEFIEYMFNITFNTKQYFVFDTLQDVVDEGISITTDNRTYILLKFDNDGEMLKFINVTVVPYQQECIDMMAQDKSEVNACFSNSILAGQMIRNYSKPQDGWIISRVKENFLVYTPHFLIARYSPYINEFSRMIQRLLESGIPMIWLNENFRMFALKNKEIASVDSTFLYHKDIDENQMIDITYNEQRLMMKLIYLLLIGYTLATFILVIEVIIKKIKKHKNVEHF
ncbi:hypothetical protein TSAR_009862 [Trichomalopsis sarcophagae]|uniref:Ionotropic glutamate receptor C-terminal domain-containing protein n=1 Tax=Trichomalopsis sarcophagae TaxID=543379 RepID=A0A232FJR2_9HYME|nr:hypothetical protein TSAR_009862 [Trichomalopsis sarcophagae]